MLEQDYIAKIIDLEDIIATNVEIRADELHLYVELPQTEHECPRCGRKTSLIHDYREQLIKDIPLGRKTYLHLRKRRYSCPHCAKHFYEKNTFLPRYHRTTSRLVASVIAAFRKLQPAKEIAAQFNLSITTALRYFDLVEYRCTKLPRVLSIDEFKGNAGGEKYQCILTDPSEKEVLDILPNRFEQDLIQYFKTFPNRSDVQFFVTDMNPHFKAVAKSCFPNATIVADRYHVIRQVVWAMENVRKNEQKKLSDKFRKYFKRSKSLLIEVVYDAVLPQKSSRVQAFKNPLYITGITGRHNRPDICINLYSKQSGWYIGSFIVECKYRKNPLTKSLMATITEMIKVPYFPVR